MLYNDMTKRYVMWMHVDEADYELARCGVATSTRAGGPFTYRGSFRPHGHMCRDFTVFKARPFLAQENMQALLPVFGCSASVFRINAGQHEVISGGSLSSCFYRSRGCLPDVCSNSSRHKTVKCSFPVHCQ